MKVAPSEKSHFKMAGILALGTVLSLSACNSGKEVVEAPVEAYRSPRISTEIEVAATEGDADAMLVADRITLLDMNEPDPVFDRVALEKPVPEGLEPVTFPDPVTEPERMAVFDYVKKRARDLASQAYVKGDPTPKFAQDMNYDAYRLIQHRAKSELFGEDGSLLRAKLDPRGYLFQTAVKINIIRDGVAEPLPYRPSDFNFDTLKMTDEDKAKLGFAGFRLLAPINKSGKFDEVLSVKGASFFRALGAGNFYGASARGLSLKTASSEGEEFPDFKEFWIQEPDPMEQGVVFYALMDGPSVTGAYEFHIMPGTQTIIDVRAEVFARKPISRVGLSPLTSMFQIAPNDPDSDRDDFRPRVHDSDGLSVMMRNGEWVWRPLSNPSKLQISSFTRQTPRGFGLMQRARSFDAFKDIEANYEARPNVWITPREGWTDGELVLVEIPTPNEYNDNIISFWQLRNPIPAGESHAFSYRMNWGMSAPFMPALFEVAETRTGVSESSGKRMFVIDFEVQNPELLDDVEPKVSASSGVIEKAQLIKDAKNGHARLTFEVDMQGAPVTELRAVLQRGKDRVSETWLYRWSAT